MWRTAPTPKRNPRPVIAHHSGEIHTHVACLKVSKRKSLADNANYRGEKTAAEFLVNFMSKAPWPSGPPRAPVPSPRHPHSLPGAAPATSFFSAEDIAARVRLQQPRPGHGKETRRLGSGLQHPRRSAWEPAMHRSSFWCLVTMKGPLPPKQGAPATETPVPHPRHGVHGDGRASHSLPLLSPRVAPLAVPRGASL